MVPKRVQIVCLAVGELPNEYVTRLEAMLRREMPVPFDLACATDRPRNLPATISTLDVAGWPPPRPGMRPTTYKLSLFDLRRVPFDDFLYLDTSLVIRKSMAELLEFAYAQPHDLVTVQDWHYEAYNTSVMRIRQGALSAIPEAYESGLRFIQKVPGDQDFLTNVVWSKDLDHLVTTFPKGMVQCYGIARTASKAGMHVGHRMLSEATIVKFNGHPKMHDLLDRRYILKQMTDNTNPFHRNAWFYVREVKELWRDA